LRLESPPRYQGNVTQQASPDTGDLPDSSGTLIYAIVMTPWAGCLRHWRKPLRALSAGRRGVHVNYPLGNPAGTTSATKGVMRTVVYDQAGRIVGYSHTTAQGWDQSFGYDGLDRLITANLTGGIPYAYAYDATGNRTLYTVNGTNYTSTVSPTSNRYADVQIAGTSATAQGYDAAGHLTSDQNGTYGYSDRGRLASETRGANSFGYLVNALEQRVYKNGPTSLVNTTGAAYYVYDEAGRILGEYNANGKPLYETVYFGDTPVAAVEPMGGVPTVFYVYADHLDTARVIVRASDQKIAWTWGSNEPFGQSQAVVNPNGLSNLGGFVYNPRFPGQVADSESGWFYNWHRDYDPGKGRYVQRGMASAMGSGTGSTPTERCPMPRSSRT